MLQVAIVAAQNVIMELADINFEVLMDEFPQIIQSAALLLAMKFLVAVHLPV